MHTTNYGNNNPFPLDRHDAVGQRAPFIITYSTYLLLIIVSTCITIYNGLRYNTCILVCVYYIYSTLPKLIIIELLSLFKLTYIIEIN